MATGMPNGILLECEFTPGAWTDITQYVNLDVSQLSLTTWRASQFSQASPRTLTVTLDNRDGRFTPLRQVLADGVTAHPYYPNVQVRKRLRYSYFNSAQLMVNGTFEVNSTGWSGTGGAAVARDTGVFHDGVASLKTTWATGAGSTQSANDGVITGLTPGSPYTVSAWVRCPTGGPRAFLYATDGVAYVVTSTNAAADSTWHLLSMTFVAQANGLAAVAMFNTDAATSGQFANLDTVTFTGATATRFVGYIRAWPPSLENKVRPYVTITAVDRQQILASFPPFVNPMLQEARLDAPLRLWTLNDPAGSLTAIDSSGNNGTPLNVAYPGATGALTFGDNGPGPNDGTGVKLAPTLPTNGQYLAGLLTGLPAGTLTAEIWLNIPALPASTVAVLAFEQFGFGAPGTPDVLSVDSTGHLVLTSAIATITSSSTVSIGNWHQIVVTFSWTGFTHTAAYTVFLDAVQVGTGTAVTTVPARTAVIVGQTAPSTGTSALITGNVGYVSLYTTVLSGARISAHYASGNGYNGDTSGARIARYLAWAGLTTTDWNLDTGKALIGHYPTAGKTAVQACQDIAATEGGGDAFYVTPDGLVRFADRTYRKPAAPVMTIDAARDLDGSVWQPTYDDTAVINYEQMSRASGSGAQSSLVFSDAASIAQYGQTGDNQTSYATTDQDALNLAQYNVSSQRQPGYRLPQVQLDLVTAENNLYTQLAALQLGSRLRLQNVPAGGAPVSTLDLCTEGWTETVTADSYLVKFDTSAADNPARMVLDDPAYGRLQCAGQTLNTTITASGSTVIITTTGAGNPTFTTVGARYPMNIQIGQEILSLVNAPGGATSPQTFTGVLRGQQGTPAAAQTAGAVINLWLAATLAL